MKRRAFSLVDIIFGFFILGTLIVSILPMLNLSFRHLTSSREKTKMIYLAEGVMEGLKSYDRSYEEIFIDLEEKGQADFTLYDDNLIERYTCKVINYEDMEDLWKLRLNLALLEEEGEGQNVEIEACFPKEKGFFSD